MNNKVSIIIPTFNRADFLVECIDSCLAQTHPCEIIVCDHGSSDNTPEVVKKYGDQIKYIRRELDSGVHFCWLDGILHAKNDLIHINYDDDWIYPTYIEECQQLFNENVGCVFSDAITYLENEKKFGENLFTLTNETGIFSSKKLSDFNIKKLTSPGAGIFRKQILLDSLFVGEVPFSKNHYHGVGPDILFSLMSCVDYQFFGYVNKPLAVFRAHVNSITVNADSDKKKRARIKNAYQDARIYYYINKFIAAFKIYYLAKYYYKIKKNLIKINKIKK
jgi:glycosyltransferase involved in cell wall biosynthesis